MKVSVFACDKVLNWIIASIYLYNYNVVVVVGVGGGDGDNISSTIFKEWGVFGAIVKSARIKRLKQQQTNK